MAVSAVAVFMLRGDAASHAYVYRDGELIERINLSAVFEPYSFDVEYESGVNVIAVENGRIRVSAADCQDGSCVRQGWISAGAIPIICLPHRLVIELVRSEAPELDAVARARFGSWLKLR